MGAAFDALHVRMREILEASAGSLRTIPVDRFMGSLPPGLDASEAAKRAFTASVPCEARVVRHGPHKQRTPANSNRSLLRIEVEVRVERTLAYDAQTVDAVRDAVKALADEDGDLLQQVFELPQNLRATAAGAPTGCLSLMRVDSTPEVAGPTGQAQRVVTLHKFVGMLEASRDVVASPVSNVVAPMIGVLGGGLAIEGASLILQPGTWANALTIATVLLIDGVANVVTFPFEILAEHVGVSLQVRETATGTGGPVIALSGTITPA